MNGHLGGVWSRDQISGTHKVKEILSRYPLASTYNLLFHHGNVGRRSAESNRAKFEKNTCQFLQSDVFFGSVLTILLLLLLQELLRDFIAVIVMVSRSNVCRELRQVVNAHSPFQFFHLVHDLLEAVLAEKFFFFFILKCLT